MTFTGYSDKFVIKEIYYYINRVGFKIKQIMKDEDIYKDRASQIQAIDKTFEQAKEKVSEFVKVIVLDRILKCHLALLCTRLFLPCVIFFNSPRQSYV